MEKIKVWVAKILLHKFLPIQYIVKGWDKIKGWRTQIAAGLWLACYLLGQNQVGPFADPKFTEQALTWLVGIGSATLIEKLKGWTPYIQEGIQAVKKS